MTKSPANSSDKNKLRTPERSSEKSSELARYSTNQFDQVFERMIDAVGGKRAADLAGALGISQASVSGAKRRNNIPDSWYLIIADKYGVSSDWLRTGEGEMRRSAPKHAWTSVGLERQDKPGIEDPGPLQGDETCVPPTKAAAEWPAQQADAQSDHKYGNAPSRRDISIADMLAKTARVLESDTVYREALYSNIEAFHHGVTMDERLSKMDSKFDQVTQRLDALEAENQRLRQELEHSRAQSAIRDTG